ncbi:pyridoxal phosphate-dependent aminotransferase [Streptomyces pacificus]|uniref:Aromatic amino acid aminotransferase n=1 Tax=Streptomyces pacificus TaxID=2705029 RepID=A0A6A0ATS1_9ACTN|nr:pyridoxal phosphate-dependent aminotransferase [Streptomyces pacificus]GFH35753.1 pyridoxal phosphate-dependent aminotransferase [Streptomyces pacificus]
MIDRQQGPRPRPHLDTLPAHRPGRPDYAGSFVLSANENPYPPLPGVLETALAAAGGANRYPDMATGGLTAELARHFGVPGGHVVTGPGSVGVAQSLVLAMAGEGDEVVFAWRSFEAYPVLTRIGGAVPVPVPLTADGAHDLDAMLAAVTDRTRVVFVCNPNNPTGAALRRDELVRFLDAVPAQVLVVLDEAYLEFARDAEVPDGIDLYRDRPQVCVLRTFSKAYGLAGLRVGFAIAHEPVATALRKTAVPFGVSQLAQDAAVASLCAEDALLERVESLVGERARVTAALRAQGWTVAGSQANFVWLPLGGPSVDFAAACAEAGVLVRAFAGEGVRVSIGEARGNDAFLAAAEVFRKQI